MRSASGLAALLFAALVPLSAAAAALPDQIELGAGTGFIIPVEVQGHELRLRVEPGTGGIRLNGRAAAAIGLGQSGQPLLALVGPVRVEGRARRGRVAIGGWRGRLPLRWFDREIAADADGVIGLGALPYRTTIMRLRPGREGQRPLTFAVEPNEYYGLVYAQEIAGETLRFVFAPGHSETIATAASGAHLAAHFGGTWTGEPFVAPLILGVPRPLRRLRLAEPVSIGGLALGAMLVRTGDFRGAFALPQDPSSDPGEIVVTGRHARSRPSLTVTIGADQIGHCSSLRYDREARQLTLTCDP